VSRIQLDGARIGYTERGAGSPPLVFVHGWCCDRSHFAPQMEYFAKRHRCVALDQRGFGKSDKPLQDYTIEGFADDLAASCRALGLVAPVLVGHSLGGAVVLATAARHPELPAAIALCDPAGFFPAAAAEGAPALLEGFDSTDWREIARTFISGALFDARDDRALATRITAQMLETPQHVMRSALASVLAFDSESAARRCRVPVLHIEAEAPIAERARVEASCAQLRVVRTPGIGHFHQLLAPDLINGFLAEFLDDEVLDSSS
jgi:pimeloyl-ACP methyl ester carboxylesterase